MWRKGYTCTLLVGLQIGATTMEISMEIPQNLEIGPLFDPVIPLLSILKSAYYSGTAHQRL